MTDRVMSSHDFIQLVSHGLTDDFSKAIESNPSLIDCKDLNGWTPLLSAAYNGRKDITTILIGQGVDIKSRDKDSRSALHLAAMMGHFHIVKALVKCGSEIDVLDKWGRSPLHWAAKQGHLKVVKHLLEHQASYNIRDKWGLLPLHWSCIHCHPECSALLSDFGSTLGDADLFDALEKEKAERVRLEATIVELEHVVGEALEQQREVMQQTYNQMVEDLSEKLRQEQEARFSADTNATELSQLLSDADEAIIDLGKTIEQRDAEQNEMREKEELQLREAHAREAMLQGRVEELECLNNELEQEAQSMKDYEQEWRAQVHLLEKDMARKEEALAELVLASVSNESQEVAALRAQLKELQETLAVNQAKAADTEMRLAESEAGLKAMAPLKEEVEWLRKAQNYSETHMTTMKAQLEQTESIMRAIEPHRSLLEGQLKAQQAREEGLLGEIQSLRDRLTGTEDQLAQREAELAQLRRLQGELGERLEDVTASAEEYREEASKSACRALELETQLTKATQLLSQSDILPLGTEGRMLKLEDQCRDLEAQLRESHATLAETQSTLLAVEASRMDVGKATDAEKGNNKTVGGCAPEKMSSQVVFEARMQESQSRLLKAQSLLKQANSIGLQVHTQPLVARARKENVMPSM